MYRVLVGHLDLTVLAALTPNEAETIAPQAVVIGMNRSVIAVIASFEFSGSPKPKECIATNTVVDTR